MLSTLVVTTLAEVYIIETVRTQIGKPHGGNLYRVAPMDLVVTAVRESEGQYGLQTMYIGHGIGTAPVIETVG